MKVVPKPLETEDKDSGIEVEKQQHMRQLKQQLLRKIYIPKPEKQISVVQTKSSKDSEAYHSKPIISYGVSQSRGAGGDALVQKAMMQYMQKSTRQRPVKT